MSLLILATAPLTMAQQEKGDKEIGIGGLVTMTHQSPIAGSAAFQLTMGYYPSAKNYFGFQATPVVTFGDGTTYGGFAGANYRRLFGSEKGRVFPFVGGGGGAYFNKTAGSFSSSSTSGTAFGEVGIKNYVSQKTSLEFAYQFLAGISGGGTIQERSSSMIMISLRHIF